MDLFELIFKKWSEPLASVRGSDFDKTLKRVSNLYKETTVIPAQRNVFRAFDMVDPDNLKVVIIGQDPYPNKAEATGYAFANPRNLSKMSKSLQLIRDQIEISVYGGLLLDFDPALEHWAEQGVLALNTAFTVEYRKPGVHQKIWEPVFTRIIRALNDNFDGLYFCFWGNVAKGFAPLVSPNKHKKLEYYHPAYSVRRHTSWDCPHFEEIHKTLKINW
jgi:uracil-DNA glycosylase